MRLRMLKLLKPFTLVQRHRRQDRVCDILLFPVILGPRSSFYNFILITPSLRRPPWYQKLTT